MYQARIGTVSSTHRVGLGFGLGLELELGAGWAGGAGGPVEYSM